MVELDTVRTAVPDDQTLLSLTEMLDELVADDAALGWTHPPTFAEVGDLVRTLIMDPAGESCLVIGRDAGQVVAFGYWRRYQRPTHRPHADLEKMAVRRSYAGRGLGRRLLQLLIAQARAAGIEQLTLDFRGDNTRAQRLYLSEGFREYGRLPGFVVPADGRRLDKVFHVLDLRDESSPHAQE